jgi:hypothetical protein
MKKRKFIIILISILLSGIAATLAVANTPTLKNWLGLQAPEAPAKDPGEKKDPVQEALLKEMSALLQPFDTTNTSYYVGGLLSAIDRTDSAHALNDLTYRYAKWGQEIYVKTGQTEMLNGNELYLFIDHAAKKILVGAKKILSQQPGLPIERLYKYIRNEGFTVEKKSEGGTMMNIGVVNPTHLTLKGISLSYDSVSREVKEILIRQAEVSDHMNEHKEKWIKLNLREWNDNPERGAYPDVQNYIERKNGHWQGIARYNDYELIDQSK